MNNHLVSIRTNLALKDRWIKSIDLNGYCVEREEVRGDGK